MISLTTISNIISIQLLSARLSYLTIYKLVFNHCEEKLNKSKLTTNGASTGGKAVATCAFHARSAQTRRRITNFPSEPATRSQKATNTNFAKFSREIILVPGEKSGG